MLKKILPWFLLFIFYSLIFGLYSWPLALHFSDGFIGIDTGGSDANQYVWNAYNFKRAILSRQNPFYTDLLNHPIGYSLLYHTYTPIMGLVHLLTDNNLTAVNFTLWASFVLSGIGAYLLSYRFVPNHILAALAGLIFAFSPYKTAHLQDHYHLMLTATIPFFAYFFTDAFTFYPNQVLPKVNSWPKVFACFALGLIALLSDYYALFFMLYFAGGYSLYCVFLSRVNWGSRKTWLILLGIFIGSNLLIKLFKHWKLDNKGAFWWSGDLAGYLVPADHLQFLSTGATTAFYNSEKYFNSPGSVENVVFLGYVLLGLAVLAVVFGIRVGYKKELKPIVFLSLLFFIMTLPEFTVFGKILFKMPTALLHYVPFLNNIRCPTRIVALVSLLLPIVCFYALYQSLLARTTQTLRIAIPLMLLLVVVVEYQPEANPMILESNIPKAYVKVAGLEGKVLFPIPFGIRDGLQEKGHMVLNDLFYQTRHHKKIPGAYISRIDQATFNSFDQDPVVKTLLLLQADSAVSPAMPSEDQVRQFFKTYQPDIFLISPLPNQAAIDAYILRLVHGKFYIRSIENGYILIAIQKAGPAIAEPE